jgi:hypothetical protein
MDYLYIKKNIYVLNIEQIIKICDNLDIDYNIYIEINGGIKKIADKLHKEFIIHKILNVIKGNEDKKVIYSKKIQNYDNTNDLHESDYIYYGQYNTTNKNTKKLLMKLTNNKFKFGAISQKIVKKYWMKNKLLTYKKFSILWLEEYNNGNVNYDELAYNKFMKKYGDIDKWFEEKDKITKKFKQMGLL